MKNKRAWLTSKETVELILAVAVIALLVFVLYYVLIGDWNKEDETAKSYMETLQKELEKADGGGVGEFEIWQKENGNNYSLVYFGDNNHVQIDQSGTRILNVEGSGKNVLCVVYKGPLFGGGGLEGLQNLCKSLNHPVVFEGFPEGALRIYLLLNEKIKITKPDDKYVFTLVDENEK